MRSAIPFGRAARFNLKAALVRLYTLFFLAVYIRQTNWGSKVVHPGVLPCKATWTHFHEPIPSLVHSSPWHHSNSVICGWRKGRVHLCHTRKSNIPFTTRREIVQIPGGRTYHKESSLQAFSGISFLPSNYHIHYLFPSQSIPSCGFPLCYRWHDQAEFSDHR